MIADDGRWNVVIAFGVAVSAPFGGTKNVFVLTPWIRCTPNMKADDIFGLVSYQMDNILFVVQQFAQHRLGAGVPLGNGL